MKESVAAFLKKIKAKRVDKKIKGALFKFIKRTSTAEVTEMKGDNYAETEDKVDIANVDVFTRGDIDSIDAAKTVNDDDDAHEEFESQP